MNGPESHGAVGGPRPFVMEIRCHIHHLNLIHRVLRRVSVVLTDAANTRTRVGDADQGDEHAQAMEKARHLRQHPLGTKNAEKHMGCVWPR